MRVPLSWLKEYVKIDDLPVDRLAERLTTAGLEVAGIEYIGVPGPAHAGHLVWDRDLVRVGEVVAVDAHPNADRLRLVTVAYGEAEPRTVVTGAPNVSPGQKVAYAATGATVINGYSDEGDFLTLEPKKLRGVLSEGMVLSEKELGLSGEHEGILELPSLAPVGEPLQDYLGDVVLEIELTPNLGRAASIIGVAREVAALFERPLELPPLAIDGTGAPVADAIRIEIEVPDLNPRFTATLVRDVTIGPSPGWMQRRLTLAGMRPINNIVDVTNYVMLELGQPLHAFDYDKLVERAKRSGAEMPTIRMRVAREGERLVTLDDVERPLDPSDILVTDTEGILSIAGIMGGAETEVSEETTNVLLEAAAWNFISIRRSSMRHNLFSEAAYRFSRQVHPAMASRGNRRGIALMGELAGGEVAQGIVDNYPAPPEPVEIDLAVDMVNRSLGTELTVETITDCLRRLQFEVEPAGDRLQVTVPDHREDVSIPADLVEEVARVYGLEKLPATLMADPLPPLREDRAREIEERIRDLLVAAGLTEHISYRITSPQRHDALLPDAGATAKGDYVRIANPISQERSVMRRSLLVSALETVQTNLRHRDRVASFEIGLVYLPQAGEALPNEQRRLVIALSGPLSEPSWLDSDRPAMDYFSVKGVVDELLRHLQLAGRVRFEPSTHPTFQTGRTATLLLDGQAVGTIGELHPIVRRNHDLPEQRIALVDLDLEALVAAVPSAFQVVPIPRFPAVVQDLAVVVDEKVPASAIDEAIRDAGATYLQEVQFFDIYRGTSIPTGTKSLAYSLRYVHPEKTLTDEEVAQQHAIITRKLRERFEAKIRGEDL